MKYFRQPARTSQALWDPPDYEGEIAPAFVYSMSHKIRKKVRLIKPRVLSFRDLFVSRYGTYFTIAFARRITRGVSSVVVIDLFRYVRIPQ